MVPLPDRASPAAPLRPPDPTAGYRRWSAYHSQDPATVPARTNTGSTANSNGGTDSDDSDDPVTGFGGVDVSDYV